MSGQRSSSHGGSAASVAAGCTVSESSISSAASLAGLHTHPEAQWPGGEPSSTMGMVYAYGGLVVFSWGRGEDGQLGIGDTSDQHEPTFVDALREVGVSQIACGSGHTVVLSTDGEVYTWGRGDDGRLGHGDNGWKYVPRLAQSLAGQRIVQVTCGSYHTAAVSNLGELFTWGGGMYGKLGHGNEDGHSTPKKVEALKGLTISQIACGSRHTAVITLPGEVYTWGDKENGVAGHGDAEGHQYIPKLLSKLSQIKVVQLSACGFHTGCLSDNGEVFTWGEGKFGRLGHGNERNQYGPKLVEEFKLRSLDGKTPKQISCGGFHTAVCTEDGTMFTFGGGEHGQLGHGDKVNKVTPTLVQALEGNFITQITCGWSHSVALTKGGKVFTWGNGDHGKLGHGSGKKLSKPELVQRLNGLKVVHVASYNEHTAALIEPVNQGSTYAQNMRELVDNDQFSDVVFLLDGDRIHAHKAILAARCEHFAAMFRSGMRESIENEIRIENFSKEAFLLLLEYLYTDSALIGIEYSVELYVISDLYQLERLGDMCVAVVKRGLNCENAPPILQTTEDARCDILKDICMEFMVANFEKISKSDSIQALSHSLLLEILKSR